MSEYKNIKKEDREKMKQDIEKILTQQEEVVFAYLYGSFLDSPCFRDIDIGVYVSDIKKENVSDYELELSRKLAAVVGFSFDVFEVKVLNFAPYSFLNNIFSRGEVLLSRDEKLLSDLIEKTSLFAISNEHIANQSLKELIPS